MKLTLFSILARWVLLSMMQYSSNLLPPSDNYQILSSNHLQNISAVNTCSKERSSIRTGTQTILGIVQFFSQHSILCDDRALVHTHFLKVHFIIDQAVIELPVLQRKVCQWFRAKLWTE
jgi:hypothetical protein